MSYTGVESRELSPVTVSQKEELYVRDLVGSVVRPVKELKGFQQVLLRPGESRKLTFTIRADDLRFYNEKLDYVYEPGEFRLYAGGSSSDVKEAKFTLLAK